ncbi:hypothetical protein BCV53_06645 [Parageobacillus thermoglucosidasius]|uniref:Uncharacterized protein n=1 Tax=Parageobacillus thermoglucosidasius TaxID=1426 RepID=A0AAN1D6A8_PARTM|nr:hypothetical protein AOT13_06640 [Parageobacillus thermoglucosidasius]REK57684.1 MAG: hypothetical protein C6P36_06350 [Geobacillus sp.]ANZ29775.1 hypothetical protein BCV53_06645 [Parageobacillus thermoglucosidasius]APM80513.1 hypothetical protein BCV54_06650 [Parageobacillus thermoglucosidasius]KJX70482.1 hypothetical protein WH82_02400 [Parageobacillus thermoglucosidasius]
MVGSAGFAPATHAVISMPPNLAEPNVLFGDAIHSVKRFSLLIHFCFMEIFYVLQLPMLGNM